MKKNKLMLMALSLVILLLATIGITFAWFSSNSAMTTLLSVQKPDIITISDVDGTEMTEINLDYIDGVDQKGDDGKITIKRAICIKSSNPKHQIEIVHTTNLESLEFKLYPASTDTINPIAESTALAGAYRNLTTNETKTAKSEILENYQSVADVADNHAFALYWIADVSISSDSIASATSTDGRLVASYTKEEFDVTTLSVQNFYYTNYILEISWNETTKETDLFYIMAQIK